MKNYKIILFYLVILLVSSCGSVKKKLEHTSTIKSDTLIVKTEEVIRPPVLSNLTINEICDSITGKPVQFKKIYVIDKDTVYIEVVDNELNVMINQLSKVVSKKDSIIAVRDMEYSSVKETLKVRKVWTTFTWVLLGALILVFFFPGIAVFINNLVKKLLIGL